MRLAIPPIMQELESYGSTWGMAWHLIGGWPGLAGVTIVAVAVIALMWALAPRGS